MTRPCRAASTTRETVLPGAASRIVLRGQAHHKDRRRSFVCSPWGSVEAPWVSTPGPAGTRDHAHGTQPRPVLAWVPKTGLRSRRPQDGHSPSGRWVGGLNCSLGSALSGVSPSSPRGCGAASADLVGLTSWGPALAAFPRGCLFPAGIMLLSGGRIKGAPVIRRRRQIAAAPPKPESVAGAQESVGSG